jgi:hypothetical protein
LNDLPPWHPSSPDQRAHSYWERVPELEAMWRRHQARWPEAERPRRPRDGDPPGSWRGDGDRYLDADQNAEADRHIAAMRAPEQQVTALLRRIENNSPLGAKLTGLDHRLKGTDRLKEKIADLIAKEPGSDTDRAVAGIWDAVRYTMQFDLDTYAAGCREVAQRLKSAGYQMMPSKNHWRSNPEYNGINSRWITPEGHRFELQFHTVESFHAKHHVTHSAYERIRSPDTSRTEMRELHAFQRTVASAVPQPPGAEEIRWL